MTPPSPHPHLDALLADLPWVRRLAKSLVGDTHRAEDLTQEAYRVALEKAPRDGGSLRGWMATVLRNLARMDARGASRRRAREDAVAEERAAEAGEPVDQLVARLATHRRVVEEVEQLEEPYRAAVLLRFFEQKTPTEIARAQGVPLPTVKTRLARGIARLRERLESERDDEGRPWMASVALLARDLELVVPTPAPEPHTASAAPASPLPIGGMLMGTQWKLAAAAIVLAAGTAVLWRGTVDPSSSFRQAETARTDAALTEPHVDRESVGQAARDVVVLPSGPASPQVDATVAEAEAAEAPLAGVVLGPDARPWPGATLRFVAVADGSLVSKLVRERAGTARSDASGRFRFDVSANALVGGLDSGRVRAADPDLCTVFSGAVLPLQPALEPLVIVAPRLPIAGRVVDESGRPLEGASIALEPPDDLRHRFERGLEGSKQEVFEGRTDSDGRFAIEDAPGIPGSRVTAALAGYEPAAIDAPEAAGAELVIVLGRTAASATALTGRVVDEQGRGIAQARVAYGRSSTATDGEGRFVLDLAEAEAEAQLARQLDLPLPDGVVAVKQGSLPARTTLEHDERGRPLQPPLLELVLSGSPLSIAGTVVDANDEPLADQVVWLTDAEVFAAGSDGLELLENLTVGATAQEWRSVRTDARGRFLIEGLADRPYRVATIDERTLIRVDAGPFPAGSEDVLLRRDGTLTWREVRGRVVDRSGAPLEGVQVRPWRDTFVARSSVYVTSSNVSGDPVHTDAEGHFRLRDIAKDEVELSLFGEDVISEPVRLGADSPLARPSNDPEVLVLEIPVAQRMRLRVECAAKRADRLAILDATGERMTIRIVSAGLTLSSPRVDLVDGTSEVLTVNDAARTLVLYRGSDEVERHDLVLREGIVNELRF